MNALRIRSRGRLFVIPTNLLDLAYPDKLESKTGRQPASRFFVGRTSRSTNIIMPRQQKRVSYLSDITLDGASGRRQVRISDLSMGGCFVDAISTFADGEDVRLTLAHPDGNSMEFAGKDAWLANGVGFGVNFVEMDDSHREFLKKLIDG